MPKTAADAAEAVPDAVYKTAQAKKLTKNNKYLKNPFKEKSFEWIFLVKLKIYRIPKTLGRCPNTPQAFEKA